MHQILRIVFMGFVATVIASHGVYKADLISRVGAGSPTVDNYDCFNRAQALVWPGIDRRSYGTAGFYQCPSGPNGLLLATPSPLVATGSLVCLAFVRTCEPIFGDPTPGVDGNGPSASVTVTSRTPNTSFGCDIVSPTNTFISHTEAVFSDDQRCNVSPADPCDNGGCTPGYHQESPCHSDAAVDQCGCCYDASPIIVSLHGNGFQFSSARDGAIFDINGLGRVLWIGWPLSPDDAWLALDRNENGAVDSGAELFGNVTRLQSGTVAANGYEALAEFDVNGDGLIDARDPIFSLLRLWADANRDGRSQPAELQSLETAHIRSLSLRYRTSEKRDGNGNEFRLRSDVEFDDGHHRFSYDVFPVAAPVTGLAPIALASCPLKPTTTGVRTATR